MATIKSEVTHCVTWNPGPPKGTARNFSAHVCYLLLVDDELCGQTAEWIKMPLGREVGLIPGVIVLDGDPAQSVC